MAVGRYVAERNWQDGILLHPARRSGRKLPDLVGPDAIRNVESTQNENVLLKTVKPPGRMLVARRPGSSNRGDDVGDRVVAENTIDRGLGGEIGTACAINIRCPSVSEYAASHVVRIGVGVSG